MNCFYFIVVVCRQVDGELDEASQLFEVFLLVLEDEPAVEHGVLAFEVDRRHVQRYRPDLLAPQQSLLDDRHQQRLVFQLFSIVEDLDEEHVISEVDLSIFGDFVFLAAHLRIAERAHLHGDRRLAAVADV